MKNIIKSVCIVLLFCLPFSACQDEAWNEHYQIDQSVNGMTLMQLLEQNPDLSEFCKLVKENGMDSLLNASQTFTIWAPTNSAMSAYTSSNVREQLLKNQIARFIYSSTDLADVASIRVKMLNGKYHEFKRSGADIYMDVAKVDSKIQIASNGVLQVINTVLPFYFNLWETLKYTENTDSVAKYLTSFDERIFQASKSTPLYRNEYGQIVYDSVFDERNIWLRRYGRIDLEDSVYNVIIPTNQAWIESYNKISNYFKPIGALISESGTGTSATKTFEISGVLVDSLKRQHTIQALTWDLIFRNKSANFPVDSISSTNNNVFYTPQYLLNGAVEQNVSNGKAYITNSLKQKPEESYHKKIKIEGESTAGRTYGNAILNRRNLDNVDYTGYTNYREIVSQASYLEVVNTTTVALTQPYVSYDIPNTLAAKYNIYAVFAPREAFDPQRGATEPDSTKVQFYLTYVDNLGVMKEASAITTDPVTGQNFVTKGRGMTTFLVAKNFEFPFANFSNSPFLTGDRPITTVRLRIRTNVASSETTRYSKTMRIDYIILEPVIE